MPRGGEGSFCSVSDQSQDLELIGPNKGLGCIGRALEAALDKVALRSAASPNFSLFLFTFWLKVPFTIREALVSTTTLQTLST